MFLGPGYVLLNLLEKTDDGHDIDAFGLISVIRVSDLTTVFQSVGVVLTTASGPPAWSAGGFLFLHATVDTLLWRHLGPAPTGVWGYGESVGADAQHPIFPLRVTGGKGLSLIDSEGQAFWHVGGPVMKSSTDPSIMHYDDCDITQDDLFRWSHEGDRLCCYNISLVW